MMSKAWWAATGKRMIRTFAQAMVASLPTTAFTLGSVDWKVALSPAAGAAVLSFFMALGGLPEVKQDE